MDFLQDVMVLTAFSAILAKLAVTGPPAQIFQRQQLHQFLADLNDPSIQILSTTHVINKHNGLFARNHCVGRFLCDFGQISGRRALSADFSRATTNAIPGPFAWCANPCPWQNMSTAMLHLQGGWTVRVILAQGGQTPAYYLKKQAAAGSIIILRIS